MRLSIFAILLLLVAPLGCENKPAPKKDADKPKVDVKAPGVKVDVDKDGVDVNAGGVKVETDKDGTDVKVGE